MAETPTPSFPQLRQEHTASLKDAFSAKILSAQTRNWRPYHETGWVTSVHVPESDERALALLHDHDLHRWEDEGGFVPPHDTTNPDGSPVPGVFLGEMMHGVEGWESDGQFLPVFASRKMAKGKVLGYVVGTYDDHVGSFSLREYDLAHHIVRVAEFYPHGPDRRIRREDTLVLSIPTDEQGKDFADFTYIDDASVS